jgi:hypothetical protein
MKPSIMTLMALCCVASWALAGPNAGGTIIAVDANLVYTVDLFSYCDLGTAPASCEGADIRLDGTDPSQPHVWKVYAAFPPGSSPRLKGMCWGIHYPDNLRVTSYWPCYGDPNDGAIEISQPGWPDSDRGTCFIFQYTQTGLLTQCYWFAGYRYGGGPGLFELRPHPDPGLGGCFGDDTVPMVLDSIAGYGALGFDRDGVPGCPVESPTGACCFEDGHCDVTTESGCPSGNWRPDVPCEPNPCGGVPVRESSWGRIKSLYH